MFDTGQGNTEGERSALSAYHCSESRVGGSRIMQKFISGQVKLPRFMTLTDGEGIAVEIPEMLLLGCSGDSWKKVLGTGQGYVLNEY
jgi:hypothetical protein